jgi:hypothetical protein
MYPINLLKARLWHYQVREGLLRAVAHVVARDFTAVARLFEQLMLVPKGALDDPEEFER